ncbi:ATP-binding protein [Brevibacillus choshinensis]|uniref:ATP-binding protein n=1 Tax=Brevibacillus choshinensis TaxID=54911 RepID=UPI002E1F5BED|nr:ATP-binding protein [Brevibacillus choshinensis]
MIEILLLNTLIILVSTFFYQFFWLDKRRTPATNHLLISFLSSVTLVLCLTFPFRSQSGYIYDLRIIPLLISFFYGGYRSFLVVSAVYLAYRFYLGGVGFYSSTFIFILMLPITVNIAISYKKRTRKQKMMSGMALVFIWYLFIMAIKLYRDMINVGSSELTISFWASIILINVITMWMTIYWIEGMIEKHKMAIEVQRGEKMNAMNQLASALAHEVRNPLTAVHGFIQLLLKDEIPEERRNEYLQIMLHECNQVQDVITEYLSWAKPQMEETCLFDIGQLIDQSIHITTPYAQSNNVEIRSAIEPSLSFTSNPGKIKQCLINMMKNGIEAMKNGGLLQVNARKLDEYLVIEIIDTGVGMTQAELNRLGMPFYSTKEKGTGLGTMISYRIIEGVNGKINVTSKKGKGTCFTIYLPADSSSNRLTS